MLSTTVILSLLIVTIIVEIVLWVVFLRIGLRWVGVADVRMRRIAGTFFMLAAIQIPLGILSRIYVPDDARASVLWFWLMVELIATIWIPCALISYRFDLRFWRAFQAWLPTLLPVIAAFLFALFVVKPFIVEAYVITTNAMAPTLIGEHLEGTCPVCGKRTYGSAPREEDVIMRGRPRQPEQVICEAFHIAPPNQLGDIVSRGDKVVVTKFLRARRWDLVVFKYPENPKETYVKRLVGLPGEEILIKDGCAWANGEKLIPPEELKGIQYTSEFPGDFVNRSPLAGTEKRPAKLGPDEYFVLGDFSPNSFDSRFWIQGAPNHPSYAVPESYIVGVVTHIYWPPSRWRILR